MDDLLASKTARMWLILIASAIAVMVFATFMAIAFDVEPPFVRELYTLMGGGGAAQTYRNVKVDGPIRRENQGAAPGYGPPPTPQ